MLTGMPLVLPNKLHYKNACRCSSRQYLSEKNCRLQSVFYTVRFVRVIFNCYLLYIYTTANYKTKASVAAAAVFFNSLKNGPYCPLIIFSQWS